ncbi:LGFP repeat-containing protein [Rhodococcus sp. NPDC059968]|uniref:LGFP repeat-containing protein n=1 Tax=Rhodococcus sp. NPDC059968 TaxID=3347017 RepID=UPI00366F15C9
MRSDREELPEGFTKEEADKAEMKEAELQKQALGLRAAVAPGCQVYWPSDFQVCGAIRDKYNSLGAQFSFLGFPTTNELTNPDGFGRRSVFLLTELRHAS